MTELVEPWSSQASPSPTTISRACVRLLRLRIDKLLKSPVRSSILIVSLHHSNYYKTQYKQLSCTAQTRHLKFQRRESHHFFLTEKTSNTFVLSCPKSSENRATRLPLQDQITNFSISHFSANVFDEPDKLADFAAVLSTGEVLESLVVDDRLRKTLLFLKKRTHQCSTPK